MAFTETARLAHYVLPVASQFEKAEATLLQLRVPGELLPPSRAAARSASRPLLGGRAPRAPRRGARRAAGGGRRRRCARRGIEGREAFRAKFFELASTRPRRIARSHRCSSIARSATSCPTGSPRAPAVWGICQIAAHAGAPIRSGARASQASRRSRATRSSMRCSRARARVVFSIDEWDESFSRLRTPSGRIQLSIPELFAGARWRSRREPAPASARVPVRAVGRRAALVHRQHHHPQPRLAEEGPRRRAAHASERRRARGRCERRRACGSSRERGSAEVSVEISDRMQPGHISIPNGLGLDYPDASGAPVATGVRPTS